MKIITGSIVNAIELSKGSDWVISIINQLDILSRKTVEVIQKQKPDRCLVVTLPDRSNKDDNIQHTINEIRCIIEFSKNFNDNDQVLIHCHAGISRSTAVAIGIYVFLGETANNAVHLVANESPYLMPNRIIAELFDSVLERDDILAAVDSASRIIMKRMIQRSNK